MDEKSCTQEETHAPHIWHDLLTRGVGVFFSCPGLVVPVLMNCDRTDKHEPHYWHNPYSFYTCSGVVTSNPTPSVLSDSFQDGIAKARIALGEIIQDMAVNDVIVITKTHLDHFSIRLTTRKQEM